MNVLSVSFRVKLFKDMFCNNIALARSTSNDPINFYFPQTTFQIGRSQEKHLIGVFVLIHEVQFFDVR